MSSEPHRNIKCTGIFHRNIPDEMKIIRMVREKKEQQQSMKKNCQMIIKKRKYGNKAFTEYPGNHVGIQSKDQLQSMR